MESLRAGLSANVSPETLFLGPPALRLIERGAQRRGGVRGELGAALDAPDRRRGEVTANIAAGDATLFGDFAAASRSGALLDVIGVLYTVPRLQSSTF